MKIFHWLFFRELHYFLFLLAATVFERSENKDSFNIVTLLEVLVRQKFSKHHQTYWVSLIWCAWTFNSEIQNMKRPDDNTLPSFDKKFDIIFQISNMILKMKWASFKPIPYKQTLVNSNLWFLRWTERFLGLKY